MKYGVYAIRDALTGFLTPTIDINDASAMRNFEHAVTTSGTVLESHPMDYDLCCIGTFDSDTGRLEPVDPVQVVANGLAVSLKSMSKEVQK